MKTKKIADSIERTKIKISELQAKLRELERQKTETENTTIIELVRTIEATPEEVAVMLKAMQESQRQEAMKPLAPQFDDNSDDLDDETEETEYEG